MGFHIGQHVLDFLLGRKGAVVLVESQGCSRVGRSDEVSGTDRGQALAVEINIRVAVFEIPIKAIKGDVAN